MRRSLLFGIGFFVAIASTAAGAIDEASWRGMFDREKSLAANKRWLSPGPDLEKQVRGEVEARGEMPKDPARAEKYVKELVALNATYYSRYFNGTKIDVDAARRVLANDDFNDGDKAIAQLLLYLDSGKVEELKKYLMTSRTSPSLFLKVRDPDVAKVVIEMISDAYKQRTQDINGLPAGPAVLVGADIASYAGIMYKQQGGNLELAHKLLQDFRLFPNITVQLIPYNAGDIAGRLLKDVSEHAAEDFIYAMYQNCDGESLWNIKQASPELAKLVDKVGERYKDDVRKVFDRVGLGKSVTSREPAHENENEKK
jgi:hypothetical protein